MDTEENDALLEGEALARNVALKVLTDFTVPVEQSPNHNSKTLKPTFLPLNVAPAVPAKEELEEQQMLFPPAPLPLRRQPSIRGRPPTPQWTSRRHTPLVYPPASVNTLQPTPPPTPQPLNLIDWDKFFVNYSNYR